MALTRTDPIDLVVKVKAERIEAQIDRNAAELTLVLQARTRDIFQLSTSGVQAEILADPSDRRVLGVAAKVLRLIASGVATEIAINDLGHTGFHVPEAGHRPTMGRLRGTACRQQINYKLVALVVT